jgi:hypothetical protein
MNASFDGRPVLLRLESNHIVLIDPLALDGLSTQLVEIAALPLEEQFSRLAALSQHGLRIGVHTTNASPGTYEIGLDAFEACESTDVGAGIFDIDSGTVVLTDLAALGSVARAFTWDRYDALLQAPLGDFSILEELNAAVGGPRFAIVSGDSGTPFTGDGSFRLRLGIPASTAVLPSK